MNAFEILEFTKKYFPLIRPDNLEFDDYIKEIFEEYLNVVVESEDLFGSEFSQGGFYEEIGREKYIEELKVFTNMIYESINSYLVGHPYIAYDKLNQAMDAIKHTDGRSKYIAGSVIVQNGSYQFYRIRKSDLGQAFSREELFHVPFSKRRKIHTKRYSIPGLPSLYLSNSVYVAWEELGRPKFDSMHASRLELNEHFQNLNLTTEVYCDSNYSKALTTRKEGYDNLLSAIFRFPLVVACSVKVNSNEDVFRPEYIVPQIILQWITMNSSFIGIMYTSSHVDITNPNYAGRFRNYVIPTKYQNKDFCSMLTRMFRMTEAMSAELYSLNSNPNMSILNNGPGYRNNQVKSIEIIKGQFSPYEHTRFAFLEEALHQQKTMKIDF